jgi:hypothetical protein
LIISTGLYVTANAQQQSGNDNGIALLSPSMIRTESGFVYIVGEVRNDLPDVVECVQVVGTFYAPSGRLIDTDFTYTDLDQLRPGKKSPFKLIITDEPVT